MNLSLSQLQEKAKEIRVDILNMCAKAGTGHVNSSYSAVEILVSLFYGGVMQYDPKNPTWEDRDRFILSKGQASVLLYPILADLGYFPKENLEQFAQKDGPFGVHLQHDVPGAEITCGSLGMGFGIATGIAMAAKLDRKLSMTYALLGDGECYEGSIWEAAMFAGHNQLNNLVAIVDRNYLCATNFTETSLSIEPLDEKFASFGWDTITIDGHDIEQVLMALNNVRSRKSVRPLAIIAETTKGHGVSYLCYDPLWHAGAPQGDQYTCALDELTKGD